MANKYLVAGICAVALGLGGSLLAVSVADASRSSVVDPRSVIEELETPQTFDDRLPSGLDSSLLGTGGLAVESLRVVGSDANATYRVGLDMTGQVCIIVTLHDELLVTASTCGSAALLKTEGLRLGIRGNENAGSVETTVYLLPDAAEANDAREPWVVVSPNILTSPTEAADEAKPQYISNSNGDEVSLRLGR